MLQQILNLVSSIFSAQQWGQLFVDLGVLLKGINLLGAGQNATEAYLVAFKADMDAFKADTAVAFDTLLVAVGLAQQTGEPVTLPAPPTGYGGGTTGDIAASVWDYALASSDQRAGDALAGVGMEAQARGFADAMVQLGNSPLIGMMGTWDALQSHPYRPNFPYPDVRNILVTDTLLTWLNREAGHYPWTMDDTGFAMTDVQDVDSSWRFVCLLSPQEFAHLKPGWPSVSVANVAPLWPGLAHVTLGDPIALSDGLIVSGLMDGVIITLSDVPTTRGRYVYGDLTAWLNIGALVFQDDGGQVEAHQPLNFVDQVYCPKTMVHAAYCKLRVGLGVVGTVTPWIVTP